LAGPFSFIPGIGVHEHDVRDELDRFRWRLLPALYQPKAEKQMRLTATLRKARWISALLS